MKEKRDRAFESFFRRYVHEVRQFAERAASESTAHVTDDIVTDAFLEMWRTGKWAEASHELVRASLMDILHSLMLTHERKLREEDELQRRLQQRLAQPDIADEIIYAIHLRQQLQAAASAITRISAPEREAIQLSAVEGLPYLEMAERLGVPLGTVRSRLSRGRKRLWELTIQETVRAEWRKSRGCIRTPRIPHPVPDGSVVRLLPHEVCTRDGHCGVSRSRDGSGADFVEQANYASAATRA